MNAGAVELLDDPELFREQRGLERRCGLARKDRVEHRACEHDDRANAVAGVVSHSGHRCRATLRTVTLMSRAGFANAEVSGRGSMS